MDESDDSSDDPTLGPSTCTMPPTPLVTSRLFVTPAPTAIRLSETAAPCTLSPPAPAAFDAPDPLLRAPDGPGRTPSPAVSLGASWTIDPNPKLRQLPPPAPSPSPSPSPYGPPFPTDPGREDPVMLPPPPLEARIPTRLPDAPRNSESEYLLDSLCIDCSDARGCSVRPPDTWSDSAETSCSADNPATLSLGLSGLLARDTARAEASLGSDASQRTSGEPSVSHSPPAPAPSPVRATSFPPVATSGTVVRTGSRHRLRPLGVDDYVTECDECVLLAATVEYPAAAAVPADA